MIGATDIDGQGAVHVFVREAQQWMPQAKLKFNSDGLYRVIVKDTWTGDRLANVDFRQP